MANRKDSPYGSQQIKKVQSDLLVKIDIFDCVICLQVVTKPKILSCGHTFCMECLVSFAKGSKSFKCPTCQTFIKLTKGGRAGVEALTDNVLVANLRDDAYTQASAGRQGRGPQGAENPIALSDKSACNVHLGVELEYFCPPCDVAICIECWLGDHNTSTHHGIARLGQILPEQTTKAREVSEEGKRLMEQIKGKIIELENSKKRLAEEKSTQVKAVDKTAQKLAEDFASKVTSRANALKVKLNNFFTPSNNMILECKEQLETQLAQLVSSVEALEQSVNQEEAIAVLTDRKILEDIIEQSSKETKKEFNVEGAVFTPTPYTLPELSLGKVEAKAGTEMPEKRSKPDDVKGNDTISLWDALHGKTPSKWSLEATKETYPMDEPPLAEDVSVTANPSVRRKRLNPAFKSFSSEAMKESPDIAEADERPGHMPSYATAAAAGAASDKPQPITSLADATKTRMQQTQKREKKIITITDNTGRDVTQEILSAQKEAPWP